jgi:hypothetical protein
MEEDSYVAMDEDGPPSLQQRQVYRDRKRRVGAAAQAQQGGEESSGSDGACMGGEVSWGAGLGW